MITRFEPSWYNQRMEKRIVSLEELEREAAQFARGLRPRAASATLVTLSGELGAGKTAFTQAVARALGVEDAVTSPTFVLEKIYALPRGDASKYPTGCSAFGRLIHIDAYRLENGAELGPLGFDELMKDAGNLVMLEWPEKVAGALPEAAVRISIEALPNGARTLTYA
jgi:tRNA threonylcarbamoyladenosine biosynthesis protein TsaE